MRRATRMRTLTMQITPAFAGRRVKSLLLHRLQLPEGMIARIKLRETGICLNGRRCRTTDIVSAGDVLSAEVGDAPAESGIVPMAYPLEICYEDDDLLVINKPPAMASHGPAQRGDITVANALAARWGTRQAFHPVTRLDRGTSGLMVIAKSGYAHERLRRILHTDDFCREYLAIAEGVLPQVSGSITLPLKKDETAKNRVGVSQDGVPARTDYEVLAQRGGRSFVRLRLFTGRTHQIRVHLAALGCPLLGDRVYGAASALLDRPALHSSRLHLLQPVTGKIIDLDCPLPPDMAKLWP